MKNFTRFIAVSLLFWGLALHAQTYEEAGKSPWGPEDEIGTLNIMDEKSKLGILSRIASGQVYDLSVEYFVGMPSFHSLGDPGYQYWLTHTPHGTVVDNSTASRVRASSKRLHTCKRS